MFKKLKGIIFIVCLREEILMQNSILGNNVSICLYVQGITNDHHHTENMGFRSVRASRERIQIDVHERTSR
jgi:hypothetical protein